MQDKKEKIDKKNKHFQCFRKSYLVQSVKNPGMHCLSCPASQQESIEEACEVHGIDVEEVLEKLNK